MIETSVTIVKASKSPNGEPGRIDCLHRKQTKESHAQDNPKGYIGNHHAYEIVKLIHTTSHIIHNSQQKTMHGERACKIANSINFNIFIEFSGHHFR